MSGNGERLSDACDASDPQAALQLLSSWDQQRIRDAAEYKAENGVTPLHYACENGHAKVAEMLLKHGVDAEAKNMRGDTPLHNACLYGHVKLVEMLLKHGGDVEARNKDDWTPLHEACGNGHVKVVEMLLKHGADADAKNKVSTVPSSSPPLPPYDGAPVPHDDDADDDDDDDDDDAVPDGWTPLHKACFNGHDKVAEMLLKHGAETEAKNSVITELLGATRSPCSYQTSNPDGRSNGHRSSCTYKLKYVKLVVALSIAMQTENEVNDQGGLCQMSEAEQSNKHRKRAKNSPVFIRHDID
ncbi:uncharacterized protein MONBRDRAFT_38518 [Monosiga brevicollis MX1]|uniref:Uncharacterized protein n=1 Tax=Monosiga brevicollis TaxID=81824 RepID=A9V8F6_MONBE|nr:uncharacterized protein MONBRDRAFT_38518 [Monosiga brevicollis MX1]EDQ86137.1 predicted protein [Monosiga brevicollis MX1]|eukprot:XP_001749062.1 hypothetical protein [Monosiga brevicollis MX1]